MPEYNGDVVMHAYNEGDEHWYEIVSADPHVAISSDLLRELREKPSDRAWLELQFKDTYHGALVHFNARNRHVVYRITSHCPRFEAWEADFETEVAHA